MDILRQRLPFFINYTSGYLDTVFGTSPLLLPKAKSNGLKSVKLYGGTEQRNLPVGYTQLESIHFTGYCYFDTNIIPTTFDYEIETKCSFDTITGGPNCMWGYLSSGNYPRWLLAAYASSYLINANTTANISGADTNAHTFKATVYVNPTNNLPYWQSYIDGELKQDNAMTSVTSWENNTLPIFIGARNNNGTAGNYANGDFYYHRVVKAGTIIQNLIPCKKADNTLGLYDLVTDTFFPNLGSGTLTAGNNATPTPDTPINIVCNNGVLKVNGQGQVYIDGTTETVEVDTTGNTATAEMLLKVGNYQDVQSVLDGAVTRKVGVLVLDGSENWASAGSGDANAYLVAIRKTEIAANIDTSASYDNYICSHVKMGNNDGANTLSITSATFGFRLGLNTDIITDVSTKKETVKAWLKQQYDNGTPVIIVYPLATATTETVTAQPLNMQAGDNIIEITQASISGLELEAQYKRIK